MASDLRSSLSTLYDLDETAWLERMAELIELGRYDELDHANLREYLLDMARRDRREVASRLVVLLAHRLKWEHQPDKRSRSWLGTILTQQRELRLLLESGTLRNHAAEILPQSIEDARRQATAETGLPLDTFPVEYPWLVEELIEWNPQDNLT